MKAVKFNIPECLKYLHENGFGLTDTILPFLAVANSECIKYLKYLHEHGFLFYQRVIYEAIKETIFNV
jgi:hypothetical protein